MGELPKQHSKTVSSCLYMLPQLRAEGTTGMDPGPTWEWQDTQVWQKDKFVSKPKG